MPHDLSLAFWGDRCTTGSASPLLLALGLSWEEQPEHFARCSGTRGLQEACAHDAVLLLVLQSHPPTWFRCSYFLHYEAQRTLCDWNNYHANANAALAVFQQAMGQADLWCMKNSFLKGGTLFSSHIFGLLPSATRNPCCFWCHCSQQCDDMTTVSSLFALPWDPMVREEMPFLSLPLPSSRVQGRGERPGPYTPSLCYYPSSFLFHFFLCLDPAPLLGWVVDISLWGNHSRLTRFVSRALLIAFLTG